MSKVIVIGNDPSLRDLLENTARRPRRDGWRIDVEYLEMRDIARFARRRPLAVVMDVRVSSPITIEVISLLKMRAQQPSLMLQVTPQQKKDDAWTQLLPASRTVLFTSETSKSEAQELLQSLLTASTAPDKPAAASALQKPKSTKSVWREQNDQRIDLIFKQLTGKLTDTEQMQLSELQKQADQQVNRSRTIDFDALNDFNAQARKLSEHG